MVYEQCTLDELERALGFISDLAHVRHEWVNVGNAIKSEFGELGFDAWAHWSSSYPKFNHREALTVWKSFKAFKVNIGYVFKRAIAAGYTREKREFSPEEKARYAREREARLAAIEAQQKLDDAEEAAWHDEVSRVALKVWELLHPVGRSEYLGRKKVGAHGLGFPRAPILLVWRSDAIGIDILTDKASIDAGFAAAKAHDLSLRYIKPGDIVVPLCDAAGKLWSLQIINKKGNKTFLKHGRKAGCFHFIGEYGAGTSVVALCEGYSTGASIHAARGWPVAVAIDAGNLPPVAEAVFNDYLQRGLNPIFIVCADNDAQTPGNPGLAYAQKAAKLCCGAVCVPNFDDQRHHGDFNDLQQGLGNDVVAAQLDAAL